MNTKFRTRTVLAAAIGALLLTSSVLAGDGGAIGEAIREAKSGRDKGEGNAAPPKQSAPRQSAPRQAAPRADRGASRGDRADRGARGNIGNIGEGRSSPRYSRQLPPANSAAPSQQAPSGTVVQRRGDRGVIGSTVERNFERGSGGNGGSYQGNRRPPRYVSNLPGGYRQYHWNGRPYYNHGGHWYRPYGNRYVVVGAPYGLFVNYLPGFYSTFWFGNTRYYYADDTYYLYEPTRRGYVVTRSPYDDDQDDEEYAQELDEDLFVYPAKGQSEQQQADDRYECHRWAADQTSYDPVDADYDADQRADYLRAMTACLTGRGYSVR
jgi:hypothetical protein